MRSVGAVAVLVLAAATLTACRTNVGVAARVDGHTISDTEVSNYLTSGSSVNSQLASESAIPLDPRSVVLDILVRERAYSDALLRDGGLPSAATLKAVHDIAVEPILLSPILGATVTQQNQVTGSQLDSVLSTIYVKGIGLKPSIVTKAIAMAEYEGALVIKHDSVSPSTSEAAGLLKKLGITVSVSPRYGKWDAASATIDPTGGQPSFIKLQPTPSAAPSGQ
jgi:predicted small secreted protein